MIALIVVVLGAVAAAVGTGVLTARATQLPRIYFLAWTAALFGLAIGLGAATIGYLAGYGGLIFRVMELGAQLIAPLSLCLAMVETAGRGLPARFAMRLAVSGFGVIALVILGTDPLNPNVTFKTSWPDPTVVYQIAPLTVLGILALLTAITAVATIAVTMIRSSRERTPRVERRPLTVTGFAALALALPSLSWLLDKGLGVSVPLPSADLFALCFALAAVLIWYAARLAGARNLGQVGLRAPKSGAAEDDLDDEHDRAGYGRGSRSSYRHDETGEFDDFHPADRQRGGDYDDLGYRGRRRVEGDRLYDEPNSEMNYPGLAALAAEHDDLDAGHRLAGEDQYGDSGSFDSAAFDSAAFDSAAFDSQHAGAPQFSDTGDLENSVQFGRPVPYQEPDDYYPAGLAADSPGQMFGQITIYTLIEGYADDFDRLTEWVVAQVRAKEPDTLVYIVHAVPTAPMQRILYEVYRDRTAHDQHLLRSYVQTYQVEQRPYVLATNVIELDLQQAKVSPLPTFSTISDMLSESGIDLTGITKSSPPPFGYQRALPPSGRTLPPLPGRALPPSGEAAYDQSEYDKPGYDRREYEQPGYEQPGYEQPEYQQAHRGQPGYRQPEYEQGEYNEQHQHDGRRYHEGDLGPGNIGPDGFEQDDYAEHDYEHPSQGGWAKIRGEDSRY